MSSQPLTSLRNHDTSKSENPLFLFYSFHLLHTPLQANRECAAFMGVFFSSVFVAQIPKAWLAKLDSLVAAAGGKSIDSENRPRPGLKSRLHDGSSVVKARAGST